MTTPPTLVIDQPVDMKGNPLTGASGVPTVRVGTFSTRGAASAHASEFFMSHDPTTTEPDTVYYSDGSTWTMFFTAKAELGRTSMGSTTSTTSSTAFTDITSFTLNINTLTQRSVAIDLKGPVQNSSAFQIDAQILVVQSGAQGGWAANAIVARATLPDAAVTAGVDGYIHARGELDNLAAGSWDFKVQMRAPNGGTAKFTPQTFASGGGQSFATLAATLL